MFVSFVRSQNLANLPPCYVVWYKLSMEITHLAIRWQSWQTWFKTKKLTNIPPQPWGGYFWTNKSYFSHPDLLFWFFGIWWKSLKCFWCFFFWSFIQLITFSISAIAFGWFFVVFRSILFLAQKLSGEPQTDAKKTSKNKWAIVFLLGNRSLIDRSFLYTTRI